MTKKDFELIAKVLKNRGAGSVPMVMLVAKDFADIFQELNPRFNRRTFYIACGAPESLLDD